MQVYDVELEGEYKKVCTPEATFKTRALVLATGAMGRKPSFKGEEKFLGRGVSYCATCDAAFCRDSDVAVVGLNQEALDEANVLAKFASTVHWITPLEPKPDDAQAQDLLSKSNIKHWSKTTLVSIEGDVSGITGVILQDRTDLTRHLLQIESIFIYVAGSRPVTDFLASCMAQGNVKLKENGGDTT